MNYFSDTTLLTRALVKMVLAFSDDSLLPPPQQPETDLQVLRHRPEIFSF